MKTVQVLGSLFVICLVSVNFAASNSIGLTEGSAPLIVEPVAKVDAVKAEAIKEAIVEATTAALAAEITTAAPVVEQKAEAKTTVETLITEIMAAVVPTIVASIEHKEATVVIPEVVVAKTEAVVVIDEALAKKDYLPKSLTEDKVVPAVTEVVAEIAAVPAVAPVVAEPVVAKTTEEVKKSDTPLVETIKTEDKPESSTASSSDSATTVL